MQIYGIEPRYQPQTEARFAFFTNNRNITIKLRPGQTLYHSRGQETDEGWKRTSHIWTHMGDRVHMEWHSDGCDCDGRFQQGGESECALSELRAGYEVPGSGVRYPVWREVPGTGWQRDHSAEAMNY